MRACVRLCARACVRACVFAIGGQSFKPIAMSSKTWVALISRRVKAKFPL